jgi:hypothetical protein
MAQGWMIIERFENWEVDKAKNFAFFGLPERYRKTAGEVAEGDLVFCYVSSGRSAFSDIRVVKQTGLQKMKIQSYDDNFAYFFSTAPVLALPPEKWVTIKQVASELDLTRERKDYRPLLQTSIRKLTPHDAEFLQARLRTASKNA